MAQIIRADLTGASRLSVVAAWPGSAFVRRVTSDVAGCRGCSALRDASRERYAPEGMRAAVPGAVQQPRREAVGDLRP